MGLTWHSQASLDGVGQGAHAGSPWRKAKRAWATRSALVAVQGSRGYWERHGYAVHALRNALQRQHLAAYGEGAVYMLRTLA